MKYIALAVAAILVGIDQLIKYLVIENIPVGTTVPIWQDIFHLTHIENRGAAFSMLEGRVFFLIFLTGAVLLFGIILVLMDKIKSKFLLWALALGIGGGIGNMVDRIFSGYVVDYLDLRVINFAIFNFADCCVVIATILIMIYILFIYKEKEKIPTATGELLVEAEDVVESKKGEISDG